MKSEAVVHRSPSVLHEKIHFLPSVIYNIISELGSTLALPSPLRSLPLPPVQCRRYCRHHYRYFHCHHCCHHHHQYPRVLSFVYCYCGALRFISRGVYPKVYPLSNHFFLNYYLKSYRSCAVFSNLVEIYWQNTRSIESGHFFEMTKVDDLFSSSVADSSSTRDSNLSHSARWLLVEPLIFCLNSLSYILLLILSIKGTWLWCALSSRFILLVLFCWLLADLSSFYITPSSPIWPHFS